MALQFTVPLETVFSDLTALQRSALGSFVTSLGLNPNTLQTMTLRREGGAILCSTLGTQAKTESELVAGDVIVGVDDV